MKKSVSFFVFMLGSLIMLPVFSWPEVDHMNKCDPPVTLVRAYQGDWRGWGQYDRFISRRGKTYYLKHNCPQTKVGVSKNFMYSDKYSDKTNMLATNKTKPAKIKKMPTKQNIRKVKRNIKQSVRSAWRVPRSKRLVFSKWKKGYSTHADCQRVDRVNASGPAVRIIHRH